MAAPKLVPLSVVVLALALGGALLPSSTRAAPAAREASVVPLTPPAPSRSVAAIRPAPRTAGALPQETRFWLRASYRTALEALERAPACRELFTALGWDGRQALAGSVYRPARDARERRICDGAAAFTRVGAAETALCPGPFRALPRKLAAAVLLHEALHRAGLGEWPHDPAAQTSVEITATVRERCGLE